MKTIKSHLLCFLTTILVSAANAQIVYTDVNPDSTSSGTYNLDINNDGIIDFTLRKTKSFHVYVHCTSCRVGTYAIPTSIYIQPLASNAIGLNGTNSKLNLNAPINSTSLTWSDTLGLVLSHTSYSTSGLACYYGHCIPRSTLSGSWASGGTDKYLGLRINVGTASYYGWVLLTVSGSSSFTVKGYAYDSKPNHSIHAGKTSGARLASQNSLSENFESFQLNISPNPVNQSSIISWESGKSEKMILKIFDLNGRLVQTISDNIYEAGEHSVEWNVEDVQTGIYFLQMQTGDFVKTEKVIVSK